MKDNTLECKSLWYKYKTEIWPKNTPESVTVHNIMRVLRSIHNTKDLAYLSTPTTSGKYMYELLYENPNLNKEDLFKKVINYNYALGYSFLEKLIKEKNKQIIFPPDMVPINQYWEQQHFQALWINLISEKCSEVHVNKGWEFSNGASEEVTHVMQLSLGIPKHKDFLFYNTKENEDKERERMRNIKVYDYDGNIISISDAINLMEKSLKWVKERNFSALTLENSFELLEWTGEMIEKKFYQ